MRTLLIFCLSGVSAIAWQDKCKVYYAAFATVADRRAALIQKSKVLLSDPSVVAFHGTSLETLQYLQMHGVMPPGQSGRGPDGKPFQNSLFIAPIPGKFPGLPPVRRSRTRAEALEDAMGYANEIAREHYLVTLLHLDLGDAKIRNAASTVANNPIGSSDYRGSLGILLDKGVTRSQVEAAWRKAQSRQGVVLGFGAEIKDFQIAPGDGPPDSPYDYRIVVPEGRQGIPLATVAGVQALGDDEKEFLRP